MVKYVYDAWGNCLETVLDIHTTDIANLNPFRYRGYYYDVETKLYFLQTRYYDPEIGRFITIDDISYLDPESINGLNLYAYCGNNPVMRVDPNGTFFLTALIIGAIVGAVIGGTIGGVCAYYQATSSGATGWELFGKTVLGVLGGAVIGAAIGGAIGGLIGAVAPSIGGFLSSSFTFGLPSLVAETVGVGAVTVSGAQVINGVVVASASILFSLIGKSGGSIFHHHYPDDHEPIHVHIKGSGKETRIDLNGNPVRGDRPMNPSERKAFQKMLPKILEVLAKWIK